MVRSTHHPDRFCKSANVVSYYLVTFSTTAPPTLIAPLATVVVALTAAEPTVTPTLTTVAATEITAHPPTSSDIMAIAQLLNTIFWAERDII